MACCPPLSACVSTAGIMSACLLRISPGAETGALELGLTRQAGMADEMMSDGLRALLEACRYARMTALRSAMRRRRGSRSARARLQQDTVAQRLQVGDVVRGDDADDVVLLRVTCCLFEPPPALKAAAKTTVGQRAQPCKRRMQGKPLHACAFSQPTTRRPVEICAHLQQHILRGGHLQLGAGVLGVHHLVAALRTAPRSGSASMSRSADRLQAAPEYPRSGGSGWELCNGNVQRSQ